MNLLACMGISHSVIHDDDGSKDHNAAVNQLIQESKHGTYTTVVNVIVGDLEIMLGIAKPKSDHRKPQHLLFQYETGKIPADNLKKFCDLVEKSLPLAAKAKPEMGMSPSC